MRRSTCENTNKLIPYLDIINEILENYIAQAFAGVDIGARQGSTEAKELRREVEDAVYGQVLYEQKRDAAGPKDIRSFRQPFLLPLEELEIYLNHFDTTRGEIASLLGESNSTVAAAALGFSDLEYRLVIRPNSNRTFLEDLFGLTFGSGVEFHDPEMTSADDGSEPSRNDMQLLLKPVGVTRAELGELIETSYVLSNSGELPGTATRSILIKGEKRDDESVQNDIERISGLTLEHLDRLHRFVRLWRRVPWSIRELDLVLYHLTRSGASKSISADGLHAIVRLRAVQERFNLSVEALCTLWDEIPQTPVTVEQRPLFDRLFNIPPFEQLDDSLPDHARNFEHPGMSSASRGGGHTQHRLVAGLRVSDEVLVQLITNLENAFGGDTTFDLGVRNLSLLYRHVRLAEHLQVGVNDLFRLIARAPLAGSDHIDSLDDLVALLDFYDWWQTTDYSMDDLDTITGKKDVKQEAEAICNQLLADVNAEGAIQFADTVFTYLDGVTEEKSRAIVTAPVNQSIFEPVSGLEFRLAAGFSADDLAIQPTPLVIPEELTATADDIRRVLPDFMGPGAPEIANTLFWDEGVVDTAEKSHTLFDANPSVFVSISETGYALSHEFVSERIEFEHGAIATADSIRDVLRAVAAPGAPTFSEKVLTSIEDITDEEAQDLFDRNRGSIFEPLTSDKTYWLKPNVALDALRIPEDAPTFRAAAAQLLANYESGQVIATYLARQLQMPAQKVAAMIRLTDADVSRDCFVNALRYGRVPEELVDLVEHILRLAVLFKNSVYDAAAIDFIRENETALGIRGFNIISPSEVQTLSIYHRFAKVGDDDGWAETLHDVLQAFDASIAKRWSGIANQKKLAIILKAEFSLINVLLSHGAGLPDHPLEALDTLQRWVEAAQYLGVGGSALHQIVADDYDELAKASRAILGAFRAKYPDEAQWEEKIEPFENRIRGRKRDALVDYLLHHPDLHYRNENALYHYFLIDVELEGCARTSRVVAATNSVQLYVHRCLMHLEQSEDDNVQVLFEEDDDDFEGREAKEEWQWRKNYRVWEANRKVFLYTENYLEPDLRDDKTPQFEELEFQLLQGEINEQSVLDAYSKYLRGFEEMAKLKIAGSYYDQKMDVLHLFGVTSDEPPVYYYRTVDGLYADELNTFAAFTGLDLAEFGFRDKPHIWHPWRKIDVQIPVTKVSPIVFQKRLFVFWVEFTTISVNTEFGSGSSEFDGYEHTMTLKYARLRPDSTWTPPQKIALSGQEPFTSEDYGKGDGLINDRLIVDTDKPRYATESHLKSRDDYKLEGFQWEQAYPQNVSDEALIISGRNFALNAQLDFYERKVGNIPADSTRQHPTRFLMASLTESGRELRLGYSGLFESSELTAFAASSLMLDESQFLSLFDYVGDRTFYPDAWRLVALANSGNQPIITLGATEELAVVNGSRADILVNASGDQFYLKSGFPRVMLRRLSTTLSDELMREFMEKGVDGLLATRFQIDALKEAELPFATGPEYEYLVNTAGVNEIDYTGPYGAYFREIFFHVPFLIANHLNSQQKFAAAQKWYHYVFDPTADDEDDLNPHRQDRNWRYLEFRPTNRDSLRDLLTEPKAIEAYKDEPFSPHAIARQRLKLGPYKRAIVMKYIDNLLDWGDHLFAQDTMESINEATMLYVLASDLLGERPAEVGDCGELPAENLTYEKISAELGNAASEFLVEMEHYVPRQTKDAAKEKNLGEYTPDLSGTRSAEFMGSAKAEKDNSITSAGDRQNRRGWRPVNSMVRQIGPAFCIPANKQFMEYWDRVEDRLFKIRNCMNISGARRELSLFAPEIDPMMLVRARAAGLSLDDVLNAISGELPPYRFLYLIERAKSYAATLQSFGAALLSSLEKKDNEELSRMRLTHQQNILKLTTQLRQWEYDAASESLEALVNRQATISCRRDHFQGLERRIAEEGEQVGALETAKWSIITAEATSFLAAIGALIPNTGSPVAMTYGGREISSSAGMLVAMARSTAAIAETCAALAGVQANLKRRDESWDHQTELATYELAEIEKQLKVAQIRKDIALRSQTIHQTTNEQAEEIWQLYNDKFTNLGLYTWLSQELQKLYRQAYGNAYAMAKLAERAYRFERGDENGPWLASNYWEGSRAGLLAGEHLMMDLQNLERRFLETNYRSLEIDQAFSLTQIAPEALLQLKTAGECIFEIPELFFDLFYPGHYRRKIKAVRLTIPCVTGPYTNVGATLTLQESWLRNEPNLDSSLRAVPRSRTVSIATSTAQNDSGVFEFSFRDERYMPFEGAGAISRWKLSLPKSFRQFDYQTINDVLLHIGYTAEADETLREDVERTTGEIEDRLKEMLNEQPLQRAFSLRQEFSTAFTRLLRQRAGETVTIKLTDKHFPIFLKGRTKKVRDAKLVLICKEGTTLDNFEISIGGITVANKSAGAPTNFTTENGNSRLWSASLDVTLLLPGTADVLKDYPLSIGDAGDLAATPLASDAATIDVEKLLDICLVLTYST